MNYQQESSTDPSDIGNWFRTYNASIKTGLFSNLIAENDDRLLFQGSGDTTLQIGLEKAQ